MALEAEHTVSFECTVSWHSELINWEGSGMINGISVATPTGFDLHRTLSCLIRRGNYRSVLNMLGHMQYNIMIKEPSVSWNDDRVI